MSEVWTREEEIRRLQERFNALRAAKISQASFARDYQMPGGASMITQHLKATRPISMEHALVYAKGFGCPLSEISPRLAKLVAEGQATVTGTVDSGNRFNGTANGLRVPPSGEVFDGNTQPQVSERRAVYRVVSVESAMEGLARHLDSISGYDVATVERLLGTLANSPDMHALVAAGFKALKPKARDDPEKRSSPAQKTHDPRAA